MRRIASVCLLAFFTLPLFSQYDHIDTLLIDLFGNDDQIGALYGNSFPKNRLYCGIAANNRTMYAGREIGKEMPNVNGSIWWINSGGLYAGVSGAWYRDLDPAYNSTAFTTGLFKPLNKKGTLSFTVSYRRYLFNVADSVSDNLMKNNIMSGFTVRNRTIGGRLYASALFGGDFGINLSPELFANITLTRFGKSGKLILAPEISMFLGSEIIEYQSEAVLADQPASFYSDTRFGILNTQISLPLSLYAGNFDITLSYTHNFPVSHSETISYPANGFFSVSAGWLIPLW